MNTPPKELSPERCHQLREGGILRVLVNLLHGHTLESNDESEADLNIELFLTDFNRKAELRARSSQQLRTIVGHTAKNEDELKVLGWLEVLRKYIERLYHYIASWKTMAKDDATLSKFNYWFPDLVGEVNDIIKDLEALTAGDEIRRTFEQFGGVFVIVDYLCAQTRFNTKCNQFESDQIDSSQLDGVIDDSKFVLAGAVGILYNLVFKNDKEWTASDPNGDILFFLGNSRSLHEIMVGIVEDAYDDGDLYFVQHYCSFLYRLYYTGDYTPPSGIGPSTSHLKNCGVIKCLAKFAMEIKDPIALFDVLLALVFPLIFDRQNVLEFVSIDGAVDMLIDVFMFSKEKDKDVENAEWYENQRQYSIGLLKVINDYLSPQDRMDGRLLAIFELRDFASILVRYLKQIASIHESSQTTDCVLELLKSLVVSSEDQRRKFNKMFIGKEVVKRFEFSKNERSARISKQIGEIFE